MPPGRPLRVDGDADDESLYAAHGAFSEAVPGCGVRRGSQHPRAGFSLTHGVVQRRVRSQQPVWRRTSVIAAALGGVTKRTKPLPIVAADINGELLVFLAVAALIAGLVAVGVARRREHQGQKGPPDR